MHDGRACVRCTIALLPLQTELARLGSMEGGGQAVAFEARLEGQ